MDISDDGKWVLARVDASHGEELVLYPTGAGTTRRIDTGRLDNLWRASFFAGGDSILFSGGTSNEGMRCYVQSLNGASPRPVTPEGVFRFRVSQHGARFLARTKGAEYAMYDVESGKSAPVPYLTRMDGVYYWDSKSNIAFVNRRSEGRTFDDPPLDIQEVDLASGRRKPFRVLDPPERGGLQSVSVSDVTPDRHAYAYHASWSRSSLYLVEPAK